MENTLLECIAAAVVAENLPMSYQRYKETYNHERKIEWYSANIRLLTSIMVIEEKRASAFNLLTELLLEFKTVLEKEMK